MRNRTGAGWLGAAQALLLAGVLAGCGDTDDKGARAPVSPTAPVSAHPSASGTASPAAGGRVGPAGSACPLPVAFDIAPDWKPMAVRVTEPSASPSDGLGEDLRKELMESLLHQGPFTAVCEVDAKPAGNIGFLRVWKAGPGDADARGALQKFVTAEEGARHATYRTFSSGGLKGVRVDYEVWDELLEESKEECAFAVVTADGPVVVHLGGLDTQEHEEMLPAFDLAQRTVRTT